MTGVSLSTGPGLYLFLVTAIRIEIYIWISVVWVLGSTYFGAGEKVGPYSPRSPL